MGLERVNFVATVGICKRKVKRMRKARVDTPYQPSAHSVQTGDLRQLFPVLRKLHAKTYTLL